MRIVCLSDTHCQHTRVIVPDGDVLVHAGDMSYDGTFREGSAFAAWFDKQPHKHKVFVPGNHDWIFEQDPYLGRQVFFGKSVLLLQGAHATINGLKFYGMPWQPEFCGWAFNLPRDGEQMAAVCDAIPEDTDVLITHGPPQGILDLCPGGNVGCSLLAKAVERVKPVLHVFGHIHTSYGSIRRDTTTFVNAAICNAEYSPVNAPIVIDI